jgi:hypothetical protein
MKNERALEAFLFWFYIHFIDRGCQWCYNECIQLLFQSDVIPISEGSLRLDILLSVPPLFLFNRLLKMMEGFMYLFLFPFQFTLLGGFFVCQDLGPSILLLFLPFCWVLCFIDNWQMFIRYLIHIMECGVSSALWATEQVGQVPST